MKIYQLIYTSVRHSLSDGAKGLTNQAGKRVFSCSEALTRENINEITKFLTYKMPNGEDTAYSDTPCDPSVPEKFPKIFRTFKLSDGRYAAAQIVYSGVDFNGDRGNFFAHVLVFDEVTDDFLPEQYYSSPLYRTYLEKSEQEGEIVPYLNELLPGLDNTLTDRVGEFIAAHRRELTYLLEKALDMFISDDIRNICIAANDTALTDMYLIALKYLLPRDISRYTGISTYNAYLPSEKQYNIVLTGTVKGKNSITPDAIKARPSCLYIDMDDTGFLTGRKYPVLDIKPDTLRKMYAMADITSVLGFLDWCDVMEHDKEQGIGARLIRLQKNAGDKALVERLNAIYPHIDEAKYSEVSFELSRIMFENSEKLPSREQDITLDFIRQCIKKMCAGKDYPISEICADMTDAQGKYIAGNIREYMLDIQAAYDEISLYNQKSFVEFFAILKHSSQKRTWRDLFLNDADMLTAFVSMSYGRVVAGKGVDMFVLPEFWNNSDLAELVAYIHSSTDDETVKYGCLKYIFTYTDEDWISYGITVREQQKSDKEKADDLGRLKKMLKTVGYMPFEKTRYEHLRSAVRTDMSDRLDPLLLSKVLNAYYNWRAAAGHQTRAQKKARVLKEYILKLRDEQRDVYNFVIPKLAIEIIESAGHYHDKIITPSTMPESFWNWFVIGYTRCRPDDNKLLNYNRIYLTHKDRLLRMSAGKEIRDAFRFVI